MRNQDGEYYPTENVNILLPANVENDYKPTHLESKENIFFVFGRFFLQKKEKTLWYSNVWCWRFLRVYSNCQSGRK